MITLQIDGKEVTVKRGTSILNAARKAGLYIPTLCYDNLLRPYGACRLCVVEDRNRRGQFMPSCFTPVCEGMDILTETPELIEARRTQLRLILINHPLDCPVCDKAGECALQDLVTRYSVTEGLYQIEKRDRGVDKVSPLIERDMNRCILCGRCVRICAEVQGRYEIDFINRGIETTIGTDGRRPLDCDFCGLCLFTCPVGALTDTIFKNTTRVWKLEKHETICSHCGLGCSIQLHTEDHMIRRVMPPVSANGHRGLLCARGSFGWVAYQHPERLMSPWVRSVNHKEQTTWSEVTAFAAEKISHVKSMYGGDAFAAISSDVLTTEEAYAYQKFFRQVLGSNNMASITAEGYRRVITLLTEHLGAGWKKGTRQDFDDADGIIVIGGGAVELHPVLKPMINIYLKDEEKELAVISSWRDYLHYKATLPILIRPDMEDAFYQALRHVFDEKNRHSQPDLKEFGIDHDTAVHFMSLLQGDRGIVLLVAPSLFGDNARLAHLAVQLHNHVRAIIPLGAQCNSLGSAVLAGFSGCIQPGGLPVEEADRGPLGMNEILRQIEKGIIKVLYILGDDPLAGYPNPERIRRLLSKLDFIIYQSPYAGPTAEMAHAVLPSATMPEKEGTLLSLMSNKKTISPILKIPGDARTDFTIFREIAGAMGIDPLVFAPETIRKELNELERSISKGNAVPSGVDMGIDAGVHAEIVNTSRDYPFMMIPVPSLFGDGVVSRNSPQLTDLKGELSIQMNPEDFEERGFEKNDAVRITSPFGSSRGRIDYSYTIERGTALAVNIIGNIEGLSLLRDRLWTVPINVLRESDDDR